MVFPIGLMRYAEERPAVGSAQTALRLAEIRQRAFRFISTTANLLLVPGTDRNMFPL